MQAAMTLIASKSLATEPGGAIAPTLQRINCEGENKS